MRAAPEYGVVVTAHPNATFTVLLRGDRAVQALVSGKLRAGFTRCDAGDPGAVELSPFGLLRGRITARLGHFDADAGILRKTPGQP